MSFNNARPSPVWLGVVAVISFGGLVASAFASGYHLASQEPIVSDAPSTALREPVSATSDSASAAAFAPIPGRVAEPLVDRERAVLMKEPGAGDVLDELPAGRSVTISREAGDWLYVSYERAGKEHDGWAHRINIEREEP
jgi:hypothetical protein